MPGQTLLSRCNGSKAHFLQQLPILLNLTCSLTTWKQSSLPFQEEVRELKGIVWYGVPNATDIWQSVDESAGFLIKKLIFHEQERWLEENVEM